MVIKLNKQVIDVVEEDAKEKEFTPVYFVVSCVGYGLVLWIMDLVCYTFFFIHPFPFLSFLFHGVSGWVHLIGGLF